MPSDEYNHPAAGRTADNRTAGLAAEHICAAYGKHRVLREVSFRAEPGSLTGLLGANGCGKTTLLRVLCQQLSHSGTCLCNGQALERLSSRQLSRLISYIPQRSGITLSLPVLDVVLMGFNPQLGLLRNPSRAQKKRAYEALALMGMETYADTDYQTLSEGQKQLCILARAVIEDAPLLLLDEPESSLDFAQRHRMMRLLSAMIGPSAGTALVTLHDPALALEYCQSLVLLKDGVCTATLHPATDTLPSMEKALSGLYGPIRLHAFEESGKRRLVVFPES